MIKICLLLALTVAGAAALQDGAPVGEAAPEPYSYAYQTDTHGASEQRDAQGRVTGFYTLADADGRERRVEYVADENGFRAKVATNEVGTKSENPANVEVVAAEPTPAQYSAQYSAQSYQAAAPVQTAQYVRQQTVQTVPQANYARAGYSQQYAYQPAAYGNTGYYSYNGYPSAYGANYNAAYGGYGANYYAQPAGYGYVSGYQPGSQYYSYRSSSVGAPAATYSTTGYRYGTLPDVGITTSRSYRTAPVGGVATYSAGYPVSGVTGYTVGGPVGVGAAATRSANYQGSSNYLVLQKRAAEKEEKATSSN